MQNYIKDPLLELRTKKDSQYYILFFYYGYNLKQAYTKALILNPNSSLYSDITISDAPSSNLSSEVDRFQKWFQFSSNTKWHFTFYFTLYYIILLFEWFYIM